MSSDNTKVRVAVAGILALGATTTAQIAQAVPDAPSAWEKCAGVAKTGANDCGALDGSQRRDSIMRVALFSSVVALISLMLGADAQASFYRKCELEAKIVSNSGSIQMGSSSSEIIVPLKVQILGIRKSLRTPTTKQSVDAQTSPRTMEETSQGKNKILDPEFGVLKKESRFGYCDRMVGDSESIQLIIPFELLNKQRISIKDHSTISIRHVYSAPRGGKPSTRWILGED